MNLCHSSKIIIKNLNIKNKDSALIITDKKREEIGKAIFNESAKICRTVLIKIPVADHPGEEPPKKVAELMKKFSFVIAPTTGSITHTKASQNAVKRGTTVITLPGITGKIMKQSIAVNYKRLKQNTSKLLNKLKFSKEMKIITNSGTNIKFKTIKRRWIKDDGDFKNNKLGNLPAGEVFIAPYEGTTNGILRVDLAKNDKTIYAKKGTFIKIKNGKVVHISDKNCLLAKYFKTIKNSTNIAELGIGTNPKAKLIENILQDEKALKTCHIAFGNNTSMGGKIYSKIHLDIILKNPTIYADNKLIMKQGVLL